MRLIFLTLLGTLLLMACAQESPRGPVPQERLEAAKLEAYLRAWKYLTKRVNGQIDPEDQEALDLFRADWKIPADAPRSTLIAYLSRKHPETSGQDAFPVQGTDCTTSNPFPQPAETVTWTGQCRDGKLQGNGILTWRFLRRSEWSEQTSEGTLIDGSLNGPGRTVSPGEYVYEGNYKDHSFHGQGTLIRNNGWKYTGKWADARPHGPGTVTSPSGEEFSGNFRKGCLPGPTGGFIAFNTSEARCAQEAEATG